jgi:hypothetical protein
MKKVWHETGVMGYQECVCGNKYFFRLKEGDPFPEGKALASDKEYGDYIKLILGIK